jgi:hypothetical protein
MQQPAERFHWPSLLQFIFSLLGSLFLWLIGLLLAALGFSSILDQSGRWEDVTLVFMISASLFFAGVLLLPSAGYALAALVGKRISAPRSLAAIWRPSLLIFFLPLVIFLGDQVSRVPRLAWIGLPPLHVIAIGLPVLWLTYLGGRGLYAGSAQRKWGIFASGLLVGPALILFIEVLAIGVAAFPVLLLLSSDPAFLEELMRLTDYMNQYQVPPEGALETFMPYLSQPVVIYAVFAFVSGVVPVIEEALKPIGVWIFAGQIRTPTQGFVAGLLSGAGFALFENLMLSTMGDAWATAVLLRVATGLLHIITTGLMGWALSLAWLRGRYFRLSVAFLTVILIHSFWNALALLSAAPEFGIDAVPYLGQPTTIAVAGLSGMVVLMLIVMLASNRSLRKAAPQPGLPAETT